MPWQAPWQGSHWAAAELLLPLLQLAAVVVPLPLLLPLAAVVVPLPLPLPLQQQLLPAQPPPRLRKTLERPLSVSSAAATTLTQ
jgi:hypothetical protein